MLRLLLPLVLLTALSAAGDQAPRVFTASPWHHVLKHGKLGLGRTVVLRCAANEYEPFRVIVRAGVAPLPEVSLNVSELRGPVGVIAAGNLTLYREHYFNMSAPSPRSTAPAGWYPDALIPFVDPQTGQDITEAKYDATPYTVEANCNQGYWIDLFVPSNTAAGQYRGTVTVTTAGKQLATVPVQLTVWDFALPDTIAMQSNFGRLGMEVAMKLSIDPGGPTFAEVKDLYIDTMLAHRAMLCDLGNIWPVVKDDGTVDDSATGERLRKLVEEKHVNALRLPFNKRSTLDSTDSEKCKRAYAAYAGYLRQKGWLNLAYMHLMDEPKKAEDYETVRRQAALVKAADPEIRRMCTEQTITSNPNWGNLYGAVNVWCPLWGLFDERTAKERQAAGEELWSYTALCQGKEKTPFWQVDFPPVSFRAPFWISWHYGIDGFLYWSSVYWGSDTDADVSDVWNKPLFRDAYWGEGMLLYPGGEVGIKGPAPSIRLKLVREALEDYEYMALAAKRGHKAEVDKIVNRLARSFQDWERDPEAYLKAREQLAGLIK